MIFRILAKNVTNITKAAIYRSRLTFFQKNALEKKNSTVSDFQGKISEFPRKSVLKDFLREQSLHKKGISNQFLEVGRESFKLFPPKIPSRAVRTAFYVTRGWILGKNLLELYSSLIFSDTEQTFSDFMRRVFCRIISYAFYAPKGSFSKNLCLKSAFHIHGFQAIIGAGLRHKIFQQGCSIWIQSMQMILF